ncbi:MAG: cell division transport system permease protein [Parcubacteria group bacterium Greene0714_36]|nr:MAG: cell division transport system permease protein [Parcubacteria group bacterium Greene0714_36]
MKFITFRRVIKAGFLGFRRNGWLSAATTMVMALVLFVLGNLVFVGAFADTALRSLESKIDITVYFTSGAEESQITAVTREIEALPDVSSVEYISRDAALARFRERHKENALIASALEELGDNPLQASINIAAIDPGHYGTISDFLAGKKYPIVEKINYFENQAVIERLSSVMGTVRGSGAVLTLILAFIAVLVAFNTIRLAIYTVREEIGIMRLVGASSWFIRGPFLVSGVLYGVAAAIAVLAILFPITWLASPKLAFLVPEFNLFNYFLSNIVQFSLIMVVAGVALGTVSSFIAVRRYLTV